MNHTERKHSEGITLIALIITIIILLILAVVTVRLIINEGIIDKTKKASDSYIVAGEMERIQIGYSAYKMDKLAGNNPTKPTVEGAEVSDLTGGAWIITFTDTKNQYKLYEDGTIDDGQTIADEKAKIAQAYQTYKTVVESMTEDEITISNYFVIGTDINTLIDEENTNEETVVFKDIGISISKSTDFSVDEKNGIGTINLQYNNNNYQITCDYNTREIQKVESISTDGTYKDISSTLKLEVEGANVMGNGITGWNITFTGSQNIYELQSDGTIRGPLNGSSVNVPTTATGEVDFETIKTNLSNNSSTYLDVATGLGQNTKQNTDIGIGTDGNVVNMDLWLYSINSTNTITLGIYTGCTSNRAAYKGTYTADGRIQGTIPQYVYSDGNVYEVTIASLLFKSDQLLIAPEIPKTVEDCNYMFHECVNLRTAPIIPSSATNCGAMFSNCTNLKQAPIIPESVTDCSGMFIECKSLEKAPEIPEGVTDCTKMFRGCTSLRAGTTIPSTVTECSSIYQNCTSLTGTITINSTPTSYGLMLNGCGSETNRITLTGECSEEVLEAIRKTGNADYITVSK